MNKKIKIDFSKLIGDHYSTYVKMNILNWMLQTGKKHVNSFGWYKDGINKSLLSYSYNNTNTPFCIHNDRSERLLWFDAIFARAVFSKESKVLKAWRKQENIYPNKYRMLSFQLDEFSIDNLLYNIHSLNGSGLKKEFHHPYLKERSLPKITNVSIYTYGIGWHVLYQFDFLEFNYEGGWTKEYWQTKDESIGEFLARAYNEIKSVII